MLTSDFERLVPVDYDKRPDAEDSNTVGVLFGIATLILMTLGVAYIFEHL